MSEEIYEITTDADGVDCYIKRGEIVRCKDCKHNLGGTCEYSEINVIDDDYCSYGEPHSDIEYEAEFEEDRRGYK